jgi:hypothetical protein
MIFFDNKREKIQGNSFMPGITTGYQYTAHVPPKAIGPMLSPDMAPPQMGPVTLGDAIMYTGHGPPRAMGPAYSLAGLGQEKPKSLLAEVGPMIGLMVAIPLVLWWMDRQHRRV